MRSREVERALGSSTTGIGGIDNDGVAGLTCIVVFASSRITTDGAGGFAKERAGDGFADPLTASFTIGSGLATEGVVGMAIEEVLGVLEDRTTTEGVPGMETEPPLGVLDDSAFTDGVSGMIADAAVGVAPGTNTDGVPGTTIKAG
jgi:hypothetical protein